MPAKDELHEALKSALIKAGWTITDDPLHLRWAGRDIYIDLGAESLLAAEKGVEKIAVEVKSFLGDAGLHELHEAVGQFVVYRSILARLDPERPLFLALPNFAYEKLFAEAKVGEIVFEDENLRLLVFDPIQEEVLAWK